MGLARTKLIVPLLLPLIAAGCETTEYSSKEAGFMNASLKSGEATGKQTVWIQNQKQAEAIRGRVNRPGFAGDPNS